MKNNLLQRLTDFNRKKGLFHDRQRIGLAVSGGLDSMVMLELFDQIRLEQHIELLVLHFNHQLRGAESDADEALVTRVCAAKKIELACDRGDVAGFAGEAKLSIETAARILRYRFFRQTAESHGLDRIALAHHADDQAETVIAHIMRGTGIAGLRGIPVRRSLFIRPLLFAARKELSTFAQKHKVEFREDASNLDLRHRRNRIRRRLLPLLRRQFNPNITAALCRLAEAAAETEQLMQGLAAQALKSCLQERQPNKIVLDIQGFLAYLNSLQRLTLQLAIKTLHENPRLVSYSVWDNVSRFIAKGASGSRYRLPGLELVISAKTLAVCRIAPPPRAIELDRKLGLFPLWDGLFLEISEALRPLTFGQNPNVEYIDAEKLTPPLMVRTVRAGDVFRPINGRGRKKVSDYLIDAKVPIHRRSRLPVLSCPTGIIWLCGLRLDERFKITETTKQLYKLTLRQT